MMKIIASLLVIVGLIAVVLYFKPTSGASDVFNSALHETNSPQPDTSSSFLNLRSLLNLKRIFKFKPLSIGISRYRSFYDTKVILRFNRLIQKRSSK